MSRSTTSVRAAPAEADATAFDADACAPPVPVGLRRGDHLQRFRQHQPLQQRRLTVHSLSMQCQACRRLSIDHRPDIRLQTAWVTDTQFRHGALQQTDEPVGNIFLNEKHSQCRTTLAGTVEG